MAIAGAPRLFGLRGTYAERGAGARADTSVSDERCQRLGGGAGPAQVEGEAVDCWLLLGFPVWHLDGDAVLGDPDLGSGFYLLAERLQVLGLGAAVLAMNYDGGRSLVRSGLALGGLLVLPGRWGESSSARFLFGPRVLTSMTEVSSSIAESESRADSPSVSSSSEEESASNLLLVGIGALAGSLAALVRRLGPGYCLGGALTGSWVGSGAVAWVVTLLPLNRAGGSEAVVTKGPRLVEAVGLLLFTVPALAEFGACWVRGAGRGKGSRAQGRSRWATATWVRRGARVA